MTKKVYKQKMFFSILTKNLNWETLTKDLVTFKRWDEIRVFQIVVRGGGKVPPVTWESKILLGGIFLLGKGNLRRSDFDDSNPFQS